MDMLLTQSMMKTKNSASSYGNERRSNVKKNSFARSSTKQSTFDAEDSAINYMEDDAKRKELLIKNLIETANQRLNLFVNNENIKKKDPVVVELFLIFLRVGEIDNVKERFQADAYFEASWEDNSVNAEMGFDPHQNWEPELFIENSVGNLKQDIKYRVEKRDNSTRVYEMRNIKGIFWERLELWDFPLDIQSLSITITSSRDKNEVQFVPSQRNESTINTNDFQQQQEWNLYSHVDVSKKYIYDAWNRHERPCFTISSTISRRPGYYLYNAYMLIFLISILGFVPFSISCTLPHFRIQTTCLLILSSINFRWIVTQKLPTVSYLTTLDKYAIVALIFLVMLCVWHAFIGSEIFVQFTLNTIITIDFYALIFIGLCYFFFHFFYTIFFLVRYSRYKHVGPSPSSETDDESTKLKVEFQDPAINKGVEAQVASLKPQTKSNKNIKEYDLKYRNIM